MSAARKRILIVEDQRLIAADLESTLKRLGYDVVGSASTGEEAVPKAAEIAPDLILMDVRLRSDMDGIEAADAIRKRMDVPIVYLTAYADEQTIVRAKATGPFGYLVKPFDERELYAAIEVAIAKHAADRLLAEERSRRRAAEEFKLLVEGVTDYAVFILDAAGRVASWNEGANRIKGYAVEEVLGEHFSIFYRPEDVQAGRPNALLEAALREGHAEFEGWRVRKDGTRFWANGVVTALRDEEGHLRGFGKITHDLTERRRAEEDRERLIEELKDAVRLRDEFIQIASHELKTPLGPLQLQLDMFAVLLEKAGIRNQRVTDMLEIATRQTVRLTRLVETLLDVSRITAGRITLEIERLNVGDMIRDVVERFREAAEQAGSPITVHADTPIRAQWDRLRVEQILSNLLANAIKYGSGKPIDVDASVSEDTVRLCITDRGIGIEMDAMGRIFGRFERAVSLRHFGGLGLGLFIARQFAQAHGGTILVQSQPGAGSTFTLILPAEASPPVSTRASERGKAI
jgi:PAS domain S-box-containing protein